MKKLLVAASLLMSGAAVGDRIDPYSYPPDPSLRIERHYDPVGGVMRPYIYANAVPFKRYQVQHSTNLVEWETMYGQVSAAYNGRMQILILMDEYPAMCFFRLVEVTE